MSDREALKIFSRQPVSQDMINFLVSTTNSTIQVKQNKPVYTPLPSQGSPQVLVSPVKRVITLNNFIKKLIKYSNVQTPTLMATLIYLNKLRNILPANAVGIETTRHRIFLSALILAAKSLNDSSPLNRHWTKYTDGLLSIEEVNMAERELIALLKWNISIKEEELVIALQPFLTSIKYTLAKKQEVESTQKISYYRLSNSSSHSSIRSASSPTSMTSPYSSQSLTAPSPINNSSPSSPLSYNSPTSRSTSNMSLSSYQSTSSYSLRSAQNIEEEVSKKRLPSFKVSTPGKTATISRSSPQTLRSSPSNIQTIPRSSPQTRNIQTIPRSSPQTRNIQTIPRSSPSIQTIPRSSPQASLPRNSPPRGIPARSALRNVKLSSNMKLSKSNNSLASSCSSSSTCSSSSMTSAASVHDATTAERPHAHTLNLVHSGRIIA